MASETYREYRYRKDVENIHEHFPGSFDELGLSDDPVIHALRKMNNRCGECGGAFLDGPKKFWHSKVCSKFFEGK